MVQLTKRLYRAMPGAPPVPCDGWNEAWCDVMGNQHWRFCEEIASLIVEAAQAYSR